MTVLRFLVRWTWRFVLAGILFLNLRLYAPSPLAPVDDQLPAELIHQLNANRQAIDSGQPEQMQELFPEGFFFCHALHGLAWVDAALRDAALTPQAIDEAKQAMVAVNSRAGKSPFPSYLPPDHGMFYSAWRADLQAGVVLLTQGNDASELGELRRQCDAISEALDVAATPFLASYDASVWPCDSFPAIHALVTYDHVTKEDRYAATVKRWLAEVRDRLDPTTGLVAHLADPGSGQPASVARATSQVILLRFLADIDPSFANQQYELFREHFYTQFLSIPCVLEYPRGVQGPGDIDSGPLIFGRSVSATVLTMAVAQMYGDRQVADAIAQAGETVGMPWTTEQRKNYLGGILPVGDIIVTYAHAARPWLAKRGVLGVEPQPVPRFWRWKVHAITACLLALTIYMQRTRAPVEETT